MPGQISPRRLKELDALRGFAALMVVTFHLAMYTNIRELNWYMKYGMTGILLFFIISGFVIFLSISNVRNGKEFVQHRFARLYPVYWVAVLLTFGLILCKNSVDHIPISTGLLYQLGGNLTMIQYYFRIPDLDPPYWTLTIELLFYFVIFTIYKLKLLRFTEHILGAFTILQLALLTLQANLPENKTFTAITAAELWFPFIHYLPLFLSGIVFYRIYMGSRNIIRFLLLALCFLAQVQEYPNMTVSIFAITQHELIGTLTVFYLVFLLFSLGWLRFIANRVTVFLGRISYALYVFHQYIAFNVIMPFFTTQWHVPMVTAAIITLFMVIGIASLNTLFIDEPLRYKIRNAFIKKTGQNNAVSQK